MIGKIIIKYDVIDSTNDYIKQNVDKLVDGTVITAKSQTKGRGRRENLWQSLEGNLYFSFLLKQEYTHKDSFFFNMLTAVSIVKTLEKYQIKSVIKYPNDIVIDNKKIAGILIETSGYKAIESVVIGVGINLNQTDFFELDHRATSIIKITKDFLEPQVLLEDFIDQFNRLASRNDIYNLYLEYSNIIGKKIHFRNQYFQITEILSNGNLRLKNEKSDIEVSYNDISLTELYSEEV